MIKQLVAALLRLEFSMRGGRDVAAIVSTFTVMIQRLEALASSHKSEAVDLHVEAARMKDKAQTLSDEALKALTVAQKLRSLTQ
jgi:hypothetical protein